MRLAYRCAAAIFAIVGTTPFAGVLASQQHSGDECSRIANLRTYSNAEYVEEAGDVVGYELVVQHNDGHSVTMLLYVYEGEPNTESISVSGQTKDNRLTLKGTRELHLFAPHGGDERVESQPVEISGTMDPKQFHGTITISGNAETVTLKRVKHIWLCWGRKLPKS
jgi:hypothetical protein